MKLKPIETPETNIVFVMDGCGDLPAVKCHDPETKMDYVETVWEVSPAELKVIQETGKIFISVLGHGIPPMRVGVESLLAPEERRE